jgi:hypothetical protein
MADATRRLVRTLNKLSLVVLPKSVGKQASHWLRAQEDQGRFRQADLVVLSHAKSGRTWLRVMISRLFQLRYGIPSDELMEFGNYQRHDPAIPKVLFTHGLYLGPLFDDHRGPASKSRPRVVLLVRDPRDIAVSQYFHFVKRTKPYKRELENMDRKGDLPIFEFVMESPKGLPEIIEYLNDWVGRLEGREDGFIVSYEALRARPEENLAKICDFLGFDFSENEIRKAVEFGSFEKMQEAERTGFFDNSRLKPGDPDDPESFKVRRAVVGGFQDYFSLDELERINGLVQEKLTPRLVKELPPSSVE